ncbi:MAG: bifunctional alpha,alpha-trehalose-phosphate synthase (UDP-forming)/trehalose-phosphatase [Flavobacterium sp.]|nr:bifunctional alpha,alpha-trehalose-phosphate synthase (UDP-forming)/trehalose-phosphatase [Flavobacterium sp.]
MNKTIIVSNRLPLEIQLSENEITVVPSVGGLATGLKSVHEQGNGIWIGWSGIAEENLTADQKNIVYQETVKQRCVTVPLTEQDVEDFYFGFSNKALWPLFHYFMEYAEFELEQWKAYKAVNQKFADVILSEADANDIIWVHDYQLLLVPEMVKKVNPNLSIGFFLHIPFPSYEIFRTFPWREELLMGMLGADLIGFHIYDYVRHFLSSVKRIFGLEVSFNTIIRNGDKIKVDSFPMGIDYNKFHTAAVEHQKRSHDEKSEIMRKLDENILSDDENRLILSIDRMDYTKGIPNRIRAFEYFLDKYPEYHEKVRLVMLAVPSRSNVPQYQKLKRETDELVGRINGKFATISWTPIWYFYRAMPFDDLIDLYTSCHIALITPLRDGMNLVAKEYIATRVNNDGVLILSEMAGAAKEMDEALLINPNNFNQIADTLRQALLMESMEQGERMAVLQKRLRRYSVDKWAQEFMKGLSEIKSSESIFRSKKLSENIINTMMTDYKSAKHKLLLLDYDGTLTGFRNDPKDASPDAGLFARLDAIAANKNVEIAIVSGRDRETLESWFGHKNYSLITDHGVWLRRKSNDWEMLERLKTDWKDNIRPILESFVDRTPGTFIEEKNYSLAWHFRKADAELAHIRTMELKLVLTSMIANNALSVLEGNKVLEIKSSSVNKGRACSRLVAEREFDFIFAIGDDWTDEYMFEELPPEAYTVKVGFQKTVAKYYVSETADVRNLLELFANSTSLNDKVLD